MDLAFTKLKMHVCQDANRAEGLRDITHLKRRRIGLFFKLLFGRHLIGDDRVGQSVGAASGSHHGSATQKVPRRSTELSFRISRDGSKERPNLCDKRLAISRERSLQGQTVIRVFFFGKTSRKGPKRLPREGVEEGRVEAPARSVADSAFCLVAPASLTRAHSD